MKLIHADKEAALWKEKGYEIFSYDREAMIERTRENPTWVHFGPGNLFGAYQSVFCDRLLDEGVRDTGIVIVSGRNSSVIDTYFRDLNDLHIAVTLRSDGSLVKRVVGSVAESIKIEDVQRLNAIFEAPTLQVVTLTITEKGYQVRPDDPDLSRRPEEASGYLGRIAALLYHRWKSGALPVTMCSNDNCSHNGDVLKKGILRYAEAWGEPGFLSYLENSVAFPISMIDKITPRPDAYVASVLEKDGVEEIGHLPSDHYMNCFVNAEETGYLVVEDLFANGRPEWDKAGIFFADRDTVDRAEKMKVCTCLNPLHTALAVFGCLLGYDRIWKEMKDGDLVRLIRKIGCEEAMRVVSDPGILSPEEFLRTVLEERLPNPFLPDMPQRIAMDTSQKIPVRFGETLKAYQSRGLDVTELRAIPLVFAGWLRYLTAIDDEGKTFELSSDPLLPELTAVMEGVALGTEVTEERILPLLRRKDLFGIDLAEAGLAPVILTDLNRMLRCPGAVRTVLEDFK